MVPQVKSLLVVFRRHGLVEFCPSQRPMPGVLVSVAAGGCQASQSTACKLKRAACRLEALPELRARRGACSTSSWSGRKPAQRVCRSSAHACAAPQRSSRETPCGLASAVRKVTIPHSRRRAQ